jgi:hypothetical protein
VVEIAGVHVGTKKSPSDNGLESIFQGKIEETNVLCPKERIGDN